MKTWRPPAAVSVLGTKFRIVMKTLDGDGKREYGETVVDEYVIHLNPNQTPEQLHATYLHELVHAILHCGGLASVLDEKTEEAICVAVEHGLAPLVKWK